MIDDFSERLRAYLDGDLPPEARLEVEAMIAADPRLKKEVEAMARAQKALLTLPRQSVPDGLTDSILERTTALPRRPWGGMSPWLRAAAIAALIGLPLGGFTAGYQMGIDQGVQPTVAAQPAIPSTTTQNTYLVVFHGPAPAEEALSPEQASWNRRLYSEWLDGLTISGKLITGGSFASDEPGQGAWPDGGAENTTPWYTGDWAMPSQAYLLRAWNEEEVMDLARRSPHIDLGGSITVRRVEAEAP